MTARVPIVLAGILALSLGAGLTRASTTGQRQAASPTAPATATVTVGFGERGAEAIIFTPKWLDIYVGDTVTWRDVDALEPHTVSFGPPSLLNKLSNDNLVPLPQKAGPPLMALNPKIAAATQGTTYGGIGYANSGLLLKGKTWSLTFTRPGTYHYICLIHGASMAGVVVVHPRPTAGRMYVVQAGDGPASFNDHANVTSRDEFFPQKLTIHVGDTVEWIGGFHTVTFGPEALRDRLEKSLVMPVPQKAGPPALAINPQIAFPSGGSTYDGTGFVSSGLLFLRVPQNSKAPPTYRLTFTKPGVYEYDCLMHPGMEGTITVLPKGA